MNKIFKVIWSKARGCFVVVSEFAKRQVKSCSVAKAKLKEVNSKNALAKRVIASVMLMNSFSLISSGPVYAAGYDSGVINGVSEPSTIYYCKAGELMDLSEWGAISMGNPYTYAKTIDASKDFMVVTEGTVVGPGGDRAFAGYYYAATSQTYRTTTLEAGTLYYFRSIDDRDEEYGSCDAIFRPVTNSQEALDIIKTGGSGGISGIKTNPD